MSLDIPYRFDPEEHGAPLAPMVNVILRHNNHTFKCLAILDSGSAVTTLTNEARIALSPKQKGDRRIGGATKGPEKYPTYKIDSIFFSDREYRNLLLVNLDSNTKVMLIGRDILNNHEILLDGPAGRLLAT